MSTPATPPAGGDRRTFLAAGAAGLTVAAAAALPGTAGAAVPARQPGSAAPARRNPTRFQVGCMTLPYSQFLLERALTGIRDAGYRYVAWGTTHRDAGGKQVPVLPADAPPERARDLA